MSSHPKHPDRMYALGQELRVSILTSAEETDGRHDVTDSFMLAGAATPLHAHTRYEVTLRSGDFYTIPLRVPHAVGEEMGGLLLGPPGATPADLSPEPPAQI
ncbi:hypothetical protein [Streptomyces ziwulingensis]|uniref:hypothetical protein n=1 Tax=Streptomyces ziwulingensis TaxID=1045501 RepID=UPI0031EA716F